jgi:hypothetical protein
MCLRFVFLLWWVIGFCPNLFASPIKLYVGIYVRSVSLNNKEQHATIDFYYWFRFKLPEDTSDLASFYNLEITNGEVHLNEIHETKSIGENFYVSGHMKGDFNFVADYENYPFDKQKLLIQFEHPMYEVEDIMLVPDKYSYLKCKTDPNLWGLAKNLKADGLFIKKSDFVEGQTVYETDFGDPSITEPTSTYSNIAFRIYISRDFLPYVLKFMIPLIIIVGLAYLVFFIPADQLDLAAGLTVTSLLAGIAFQWTISDDLPEVGYLVCVDKIFYLSYILILLAMAQTVWTYHLDQKGKKKLSDFLETLGQWLFPTAFFGGSIWFMISSYLG